MGGGTAPGSTATVRGRVYPRELKQVGRKGTVLPVYPRVGGGTGGVIMQDEAIEGLRGRGNRHIPPMTSLGSIPAWAGEPFVTSTVPGLSPRGRGNPQVRYAAFVTGLSPRGRGNLSPALKRCKHWGSIPAWAGEPLMKGRGAGSIPAWAGEPVGRLSLTPKPPVYPRVGGGNSVGHW